MAAAASTQTVRIKVDDIEIEVPEGELIVESAKRLGIEIPIFCYHERLKPVGMCRMCFVDVGFTQDDGSVRPMPKPQAACTLPASEGMVVTTDSEAVRTDRKGVLELLLINHPLDCPVCDRGGECPLQNNTLEYGPSVSRYHEVKRHLPKAFPLSKYVTLDLERCIQCGRCVRFTEEISGDGQLAFRFRGAMMQPSTFKLTDFDSKFSGNVIEICPVGALTNAKYRFRARPWDLETTAAICTMCSNGCNVWFDHRSGKLSRINARTNEAVNEEWTCDKGKFGHAWYNDERPDKVLVRDGEELKPSSWSDAYSQIEGAFSGDVAGLVMPDISNESLYLFKKLFKDGLGSPNIDHRWGAEKVDDQTVSTPIADFEQMKGVLVFGSSLADELPIVFLRVRKTWLNNGTKVIVASESQTDVDGFADIVLRYPAGEAASFAKRIANLINGKEDAAKFAADCGVEADDLKEAVAALREKGSIITTEALESAKAVSTLSKIAGVDFNFYAVHANGQGAREIGITPGDSGMATGEILKAAADGKLKALWLVNCDPTRDYPDKDLATKALENVEFLVYQGDRTCEAVHYASVVLPMAAPAEQDGTFTSCERRVQRMQRAIKPVGDAKPGWRIFSEFALRQEAATPHFSAKEVLQELAAKNPNFASVDYGRLEGEGLLLGDDKAARTTQEGQG